MGVGSQTVSPPVKNNRFEKLNTQDLCAIYALLLPSIFDFCAAILKALPFWSE